MAEGDLQELTPGTVLSHFVLDELIGGGAMGAVWKGSDRRDGTRVAVKIMAPEFSKDPLFRQRFEREAHLATLLKSPYTVQTLAFGREHGHYYIVMEFVEGDSVERRLESGPLEVDEGLEIASDAARALEAAAAQKIVHRDLKPSNIIVSPDGAAKLVDFGIAGQSSVQDQGGAFMGTVQYAAPEQQRGNVDQRTDIYALGATLFHMLAGRPPYSGRSNDQILAQHMHSPFPAALLSLHPEPVVDIIRRCMQKDPDDRYQSAAELAAALDRVRQRLMQQRTLVPPVVPDQYRTLVPEPEDPALAGGTVIVAPPGATPGPAAPTDRTVVFGAPAATPAAATVVESPARQAPPALPAEPPAAVPPASREAPAPQPSPSPASGGSGGRRPLMLVGLGGLAAVAAAAGAFFAFAGGGDDDDAPTSPATATASATETATVTARAASPSPSASPSASPEAPETPTGSATATTSPTQAPTTAPTPTQQAGNPTPVPPTPTQSGPPPTPTPVPPTATPVPSNPTYTLLGITGSGCGPFSASVSFSNINPPVTMVGNWQGPTPFSVSPATLGSPAGFANFPTVPDLAPGTYTFTASVNGVVVASGSKVAAC